MCGRHTEIETYCNYYALSLSDVITKRRKDDIRFISNEIWYVLKSLLEVSVLLRKHSYNFGAYRSRNITLSSEGYLKLYILHLNKLEALTESIMLIKLRSATLGVLGATQRSAEHP